jgi:hypothetical protein
MSRNTEKSKSRDYLPKNFFSELSTIPSTRSMRKAAPLKRFFILGGF